MFRLTIKSLALSSMVALTTATTAIAQIPQLTPIPSRVKIPGNIRLIQCPNPAAHQINFNLVSRNNFQGRVRITGIIKNVGNAAYESSPNQQLAYLYEDSRLVATGRFQNLTPGQEVTPVVYERNWDASSPAEGEFPPTYKLIIGYDPDITLDSNPRNDDCQSNNNQLTRSGSGINDLFRSR